MITKDNLHTYYHMWDGKYKRLTRKFEQDVPDFDSHEEARNWLKALFGDNIMLTGTDVIDGEKLWRYTLAVDRPVWEAGQKLLAEDGMPVGMQFLMSTHEFQILDSGSLHITF
jgi:hypothetical protein